MRAAAEEGLTRVRIIHGKGTGTLRRIVQSVLERHPNVASFTLGDERSGSWGATLVGDHSSPELLREVFGLSKKAFKRAAGRLLKQGLVELDAQGCLIKARK